MAVRLLLALTTTLSVLLPGSSAAQEAQSPSVTVRTSVKATALFAERTSPESMLRIRVEPELRTRWNITFEAAYDQRLRHSSSSSLWMGALDILPSETTTPFRARQLTWRIGEAGPFQWRHEVDRASAQLHVGRSTVTVGRQAIGWGRGVMFTAVDLLAPFSPLEVDREWRSGVDAVRADVKVTEQSSLDMFAAFGDSADRSAFGIRARGYVRNIDLEIVGGRRARDLFVGLSSSAAIGDAEAHGEAVVFRVPEAVDHRLVWKLVAGGSYRIPIGRGILAYAEYHYSGFGARNPEEIGDLIRTPEFLVRVVRGDMQILSRHAFAITGSYEASPEMAWAGQWLHNPADGSGIVAPALTYTVNNTVSVLASGFLAYGRRADGSNLGSEYGASPRSGLLQLRVYF